MFKSKVILILRDIFPDWLYHLNILTNKVLYKFLSCLVYPQYMISDIIGVQTAGDRSYLLNKGIKGNIVVINNWQSVSKEKNDNCKKNENHNQFFESVKNFKKKNNGLIFTYLGSTSPAQDIQNIFSFLKQLNKSTQKKIQLNIFARDKAKTLHFFNQYNDSIHSEIKIHEQVLINQIPFILRHTDYGIVSLNKKHVTNNIPGKFVTYTQFSVPVLCFAKRGQDLTHIIENNKCGYVISSDDKESLYIQLFEKITKYDIDKINLEKQAALNVFKKFFCVKKIVKDIIKNYENSIN